MKIKRSLCILMAIGLCLAGRGAKAEAGPAAGLRAFGEALQEHADALEENFSVPCAPALAEVLKQPSVNGKEDLILSELRSMTGMAGSCSVIWYDDRVEFRDVGYYAGWRILRLCAAGQEGRLSGRERETLEAARGIVGGASGSDLEKERYIYDALCGRISYETLDTGHGDNDCAVGALLNGRADCDGYSDAMMLCCGLAGIPCRYMSGKALKPSAEFLKSRSHMWNLVNIGGVWLMTDVTWGDRESDIYYLYFNLGTDDAADYYAWQEECLLTGVAKEADPSVCRMADQQPVTVRSLGEVYYAAREAVLSGAQRLLLLAPDERFWESDSVTFRVALQSGAIDHYTYDCTGRRCEVVNIRAPESFCFCDSAEDILSVIEACAERKIPSFTLFLHPALAAGLLDGEGGELMRVLSESRLSPIFQVGITKETGKIEFSDVSFEGPIPRCNSEEEAVALVLRELENRPVSLSFLLGDGVAADRLMDRVAETVYSNGVDSMGYSRFGNRIIMYFQAYCEHYCIAETAAEVLDFLTAEKEKGTKEVMVFCRGSLYGELAENEAAEFFSLLRRAGFTQYSVYVHDVYKRITANNLE